MPQAMNNFTYFTLIKVTRIQLHQCYGCQHIGRHSFEDTLQVSIACDKFSYLEI